MDASVKLVVEGVVFVALLILAGLAGRSGFESLISQPIVEPLAAANEKWLGWLKTAQPYIVVALSVVVSVVGKIDVVGFLNSIAPVFQGDPQTFQVVTGVVMALSAIFAHDVLLNKPAGGAPGGPG